MSSADDFKSKGNNCMKNQDFKAAIENYKKGLAIDPKNPILNCNIAQAYLNVKEYAEAEKCAKTAIENQENYVKAYYRAAKGALGRHNVYDCMLYLAQGVQKCANMDLEDVFGMAKELSQEFENALRTFRDKEKTQKRDMACSSKSEAGNQNLDAGAQPEPINDKKAASSKVPNESAKKTNADTSTIKIKEDKLKQNRMKQKEIEEQEKLLESQKKQLKEESERELRELEDLKKQEELKECNRKEQERIEAEKEKERKEREQKECEEMERKAKERERKEQERKEAERKEQERKEAERKEQERKEAERKEQERKEVERKEQERKEVERKEQERKERERLEQERKERERKDQERKERERKERERLELERKVWEKKEQEKKALHLKLQQQEEGKRRREEEIKSILKEEERASRRKSDAYYEARDGSLALFKGLNRKATDSFKKCLQQIQSNPSPEALGFDDPMDLVVLHFAFSQALILSDEYKDIVKAINLLENLEKEGKHSKFPAIFHSLGRAYMRLNRHKNALQPLERGISFLKRGTSFSRYSWPGTDEVIDLTDRSFLKDSLQKDLQICKLYHKPDAVCFSDNCLDNSQHLVPSHNIFFSDPDFIGFVNVICQEHCKIYFHLSCWKDYKETLSEVEKLSEKDFLGRACFTPDCLRRDALDERSVIVKVSIIGPDGEEKSSCECTPPTKSPPLMRKESESVDKSPKKKHRRKDTDKHVSKRTRQSSRSQGGILLNTAPVKNLNGCTDALSKLAAAREHNFGYDSKAPDPSKVSMAVAPLSNLGRDEEFVYSYFLEIFKREGYMTIFKLQEHWETNKELLPILEPALITHTDLVKFLLDTEGFAVVQDMIGISSELPNISAIVEAKAEIPQPVVYGWKPSPATVLEARKTLSFASVSIDGETVREEIESKYGGEDVFFFGSDRLSTSEDSSATDCSSYKSAKDEFEFHKLSETDEQLLVQSSTTPVENELLYDRHWSKMKDLHSSITTKVDNVECSPKKESNNNILNINAKVFETSSPGVHKLSSAKSSSSELAPGKKEDNSNSSQEFSVVTKELIEVNDILTSNGHTGDPSTDSNTISVKPPVAPNTPKSSWKPRAKLLEWACQTFPGETKVKLWKALTCVRAQNNFTLSGLPFDIIADRVRDALLSSECADI